MEQDTKPRDIPMNLSLIKQARTYSGEKTASSISVAGKTDSYMLKKEIRTLPNTIHKSKLKMDYRPKGKAIHYKTLRGKHRENTL